MRRRLVRPTAVAALGVLALASGAACTTSTATPAPTRGTTASTTPTAAPTTAVAPLVVGAVFDHTTLDPTRQFDRSGAMLTHALYETLTTLDPDDPTKVVPGMAEYTLSPEGRWLTLRLRKGLVFSDGTPVTTDDVLFTLQRARGLSGPAGVDPRHRLGGQGRRPHLHAQLSRLQLRPARDPRQPGLRHPQRDGGQGARRHHRPR